MRTAARPSGTIIWTRPHFVLAVAAQFLYVAAQTGVFSFFINYVVSDMPRLTRRSRDSCLREWTLPGRPASRSPSARRSRLLSFGGFGLFLLGRFTGSLASSWFKADKDTRALRAP